MQRTFHANFQTAWNACHIMIPHLKISGATILNTSSVGGLIGVFGYTDYSAAKFAIIGFSEALRQEMMKYNIRVQVLCPPDTDTPGFENENKTKPIETKMISASAKLLTSEMVADECIRKLSSKQFLIIPGFDGKLSWWLKRHFPTFVDWAIKKSIKV
jgi:3-dehydrosphinganine reductase